MAQDLRPGDGPAWKLHKYWTVGEGRAKWAASPTPYRTLLAHLVKYMPPRVAKGLAARYFKAVFGYWPGSRKGKNPVGPG